MTLSLQSMPLDVTSLLGEPDVSTHEPSSLCGEMPSPSHMIQKEGWCPYNRLVKRTDDQVLPIAISQGSQRIL